MRFATSACLLILATGGPSHELHKPIATFDLPSQLTEISGLTDLDEHTVACLQDEEAVLYTVDLRDGHIRERHPFGPPGDMEGLTRVGNRFFALRSDGLIYDLRCNDDRYVAVDSFQLKLPHHNIEGLCYDERMHRVLVAPKDQLKGDHELRDRREVFAFDPVTHQLLPRPVLTFSVEEVLQQAMAAGATIPMRTTPKGRQVPMIKFRMSSVALDRIASDHYFILSAVDHTLLVLDRRGGFVALHLLDASLLPKPEGLTFMPNGDMIITSEGKGTPPRLVHYSASN